MIRRGKARLALMALWALAFCASVILFPGTPLAEPLALTQPEDLRDPILSVEGRAYVLTPTALYRFQPESESWTVLTKDDGLPDPPLANMNLTEDEIWIVGAGASFTAARAEDWQRYDPGEGPTRAAVHAVAADADYAYAATDSGAMRFDRYVLAWDPIPGPDGRSLGQALDVEVADDRVWFALHGAVAEFRKQTEGMRLLALPQNLRDAPIFALSQSASHLWALTPRGIGRYDKELETWSEFLPGVDLPDARIHQVTQKGDDLWLGTDDGLWSYQAQRGIWRRDEKCTTMPGTQVHAFSLERGTWVATESAYARYDDQAARWIEFTEQVPLAPGAALALSWTADALLLLAQDRIVYAATRGENDPRLFTFREEVIARESLPTAAANAWRPVVDENGAGLRRAGDEYVLVKGGATVYIENDAEAGPADESDYAHLVQDTRLDLALSGRFRGDRTLSGHLDTTDPDNESYLVSFRGSSEDRLRSVSAGELEQQFFNSRLSGGAGLEGGALRGEVGRRSETTHRRLVTADGWAGLRRTFPGREIFYPTRDPSGDRYRKLAHEHLIAGSEEFRLDGELLRVNFDYTIDWEHGSFILSDNVLFDEGAALEVFYYYELQGNDAEQDEAGVPDDRDYYAAQLGLAPAEQLFAGIAGASWSDSTGGRTELGTANARFEWRRADGLLRVMPEIAVSRDQAGTELADNAADATDADETGLAGGLAFDARYRGLEVSSAYRSLESGFHSLEDRRTRLGRLSKDAEVRARWALPRNLQATLEWDEKRSSLASSASEEGRESWLLAGMRWLPSRLPSIGLFRGRATVDSLESLRKRWITRAELDLESGPEQLGFIGVKRLGLRALLQRSDREQTDEGDPGGSGAGDRRITDQTYIRMNGSAGSPFAWNADWDERWTHQPSPGPHGLQRIQNLDLSFQSQPHASLNTYWIWDAARELDYKDLGGTAGFTTRRSLTTVTHLYPGWILRNLRPLSMRLDLKWSGNEGGAAGEPHPGGSSLWQAADADSLRGDDRFGALETRLQLLAWLRLVERVENEHASSLAPTPHREDRRWLSESRVELRPSGGQLVTRLVIEQQEAELLPADTLLTDRETRRVAVEWSQTWGSGFLSSLLVDVRRVADLAGARTHTLNPQVRGTYRDTARRFDAALGMSYAREERTGIDSETGEETTHETRFFELNATVNLQPMRILALRLDQRTSWRREQRPDHAIEVRVNVRV